MRVIAPCVVLALTWPPRSCLGASLDGRARDGVQGGPEPGAVANPGTTCVECVGRVGRCTISAIGGSTLRTLVAALCTAGLLLVVLFLPVIPVQETMVVAPIAGPDDSYQPAPTRMVTTSLVELFSGKSGVSYSLDLLSLGAFVVLMVVVWFLARAVSRRFARRPA